MSHFSVLVIGPNYERALAPFHEFESTGINDVFVQSVDETANVMAEYAKLLTEVDDETKIPYTQRRALTEALEWFGLSNKRISLDESPDLNGKHMYGYAIIDGSNNLVKAVRRTNPDAKWDWYVMGGRWRGRFMLRPGRQGVLGDKSFGDNRNDAELAGRADQARKGDIDFAAMRNAAGDRARNEYRAAWAVLDAEMRIAGDKPNAWNRWRYYTSKVDAKILRIEEAREQYWAQPALKAFTKLRDARNPAIEPFTWEGPDELLKSEEKYVGIARDNACMTFAVVDARNLDERPKWYERGKMGWWGIVSNEKDQDVWVSQYNALIDTLPDDTLLTIVDCHI